MKKADKGKIIFLGALLLSAITLLCLILYCVIWPDNLMHSDTAAEVVLSKLLSGEGGIISKNWFYSTEIRIIYTQLIMAPLFWIFSDYTVVKLISIVIMDLLLVAAYYFTGREFSLKKASLWISMALLLAPLSNEYLDMMFIGNFYTSQVICTFLVLTFFMKEMDERTEKQSLLPKYKDWKYLLRVALLCVTGTVLGLSGLRYLASLYLPLVLAVCFGFGFDTREKRSGRLLPAGVLSVLMLFFAGVGFLINKFYLAVNYSFDTTSEVSFVPLSDVPDRFMTSLKLMLELFGYREIQVVTPLGIVNAVKFAFLIFVIYVVWYLTKHRYDLLNQKQRLLLYYFYGCFLLNWYMLIFTDVLQQYRYWLPVYVTAVPLIGIYFDTAREKTEFFKPAMAALAVITVLSSLYGELWQDTKYNDCEKRYGYMEFLEENEYTFGYATFWNSSVTEYLSDGKLEVGNLGGHDGIAAPYEWLSPKCYYKEGYHTGKTFLLLARTEEAGMLNGDFTVMPDGVKVYEDEYYAIYEGTGMYLFDSSKKGD